MTIREPTLEDNESLCKLFSEKPMGQQVQVCFDRGRDFFASARVQVDSPWSLAAFDDDSGDAIACFSAGTCRMVAGGEPCNVRYISDIRIHPTHGGGRLLFEGYRRLAALMAPGEWAHTFILRDNVGALDLLTSKRAGLLYYEPAGTYVTCFLPARQRARISSRYRIKAASAEDIPEMQSLYSRCQRRYALAPTINLHRLHPALQISDYFLAYQKGRLVSMAGLWDQSALRRVRLHGYASWLGLLGPCLSVLTGVPLPKQGEIVRLTYLSSIACLEDHRLALRDLILSGLRGLDQRTLLVADFDSCYALLRAVHDLRLRL